MSKGDSTEKRMTRLIRREGEKKISPLSVIFILALFCNVDVYAEALDSQLKKAFNKGGRFVMPDTEELQQVHVAYQMELTGQPANDLWKMLSMERISDKDFLYLQEAIDKRTGRGLFAMRRGDKIKPWLLQAPHAKSDLYTGRIVAQIFSEREFKAAMWNSVPRKTRVESSLMKMTADMAHLPNTYWQAVTGSFAQQYQNGKIIQIHGYAQSKRKSVAGRDSDVIISAGHKTPPLWVKQYAECLKKSLPVKVSLYPNDVKELGATTNVQGHLLQNLGFNGFLHIELSKPMRQQLLKRKDFRQILFACIK